MRGTQKVQAIINSTGSSSKNITEIVYSNSISIEKEMKITYANKGVCILNHAEIRAHCVLKIE